MDEYFAKMELVNKAKIRELADRFKEARKKIRKELRYLEMDLEELTKNRKRINDGTTRMGDTQAK